MWLVWILAALIQPDPCPPCLCEAECDGHRIVCRVTTSGDGVSMSFDPGPMLDQIAALTEAVQRLNARVQELTEMVLGPMREWVAEWSRLTRGPNVGISTNTITIQGATYGGEWRAWDLDEDGDVDMRDLAFWLGGRR